MTITAEQLDNWFTYHAPSGQVAGSSLDKIAAYQIVRDKGKELAAAIVACTPASAD